MGFAVIFVMSSAALITWAVQHFILIPLNIGFLQTVVFILVIASIVQLVEMAVKKTSPRALSGSWDLLASYHYELRCVGYRIDQR